MYILIGLSILGLFLIYKMYKKENMKIVESDEKDIIKQELSEVEEHLSKSGEKNVLSDEEKDLGQVKQEQPKI